MAFVPIADEPGLIDEGHRMHHCVADRAAACEARRVLILSIRDGAGRRLATAEYQLTQSLPRSPATMRLSLVLGPLNAAVTPAVRKAAERAIEVMRAWWRRSDPGSRVMLLGCDSDNRLWDLQCMTTSHRELITRPGSWRLTEVDSFHRALRLPGLRLRAIDCQAAMRPELQELARDPTQPALRRSGLQAWLDETEGHPIESDEALVRWWSVLDKRQRRQLTCELEPALDEPADWTQCGLFERPWFDGRDRALWWLMPRIEGLPGCPIVEDEGHHGRRPFALLCVGVEEANAWAQEVGLPARFVEFSPSADLVDAIGWIGGDA